MESSDQSIQKGIGISSNKSTAAKGPFVYGFIDLFSGCGESWHWGLAVDDNRAINSSVKSNMLDGSRDKNEVQEKKIDKITKPLAVLDTKQVPLLSPKANLATLKEEGEDDIKSISTSGSSESIAEQIVGTGMKGKKEVSNTGFLVISRCLCSVVQLLGFI